LDFSNILENRLKLLSGMDLMSTSQKSSGTKMASGSHTMTGHLQELPKFHVSSFLIFIDDAPQGKIVPAEIAERTIFIKGLNMKTTEDKIYQAFTGYGRIAKVSLIRDIGKLHPE